MTPAVVADRPAITAFLSGHCTTSMFPLANLQQHGMEGGHPRAMRFWLRRAGGAITDVLCQSEEGMVFPQCPRGDWGAAAAVISGVPVKGIIGAADQVAGLRAALGLPVADTALDQIAPQFALPLDDLVIPDCGGVHLVPMGQAQPDVVVAWRMAYLRETMPVQGEDVPLTAANDVARYLEADSHRVLYAGDRPVAMTGFNAVLPDIVQIGGVYTPPDLRGHGYARRAVALHLVQARDSGVRNATLFAASDGAARAYRAIGFERTGDFAILIFADRQIGHG